MCVGGVMLKAHCGPMKGLWWLMKIALNLSKRDKGGAIEREYWVITQRA